MEPQIDEGVNASGEIHVLLTSMEHLLTSMKHWLCLFSDVVGHEQRLRALPGDTSSYHVIQESLIGLASDRESLENNGYCETRNFRF